MARSYRDNWTWQQPCHCRSLSFGVAGVLSFLTISCKMAYCSRWENSMGRWLEMCPFQLSFHIFWNHIYCLQLQNVKSSRFINSLKLCFNYLDFLDVTVQQSKRPLSCNFPLHTSILDLTNINSINIFYLIGKLITFVQWTHARTDVGREAEWQREQFEEEINNDSLWTECKWKR